MGPTSYCLGPMLYSIYDVSRIVGNEMGQNASMVTQISFMNLQVL